MQISAQWRSHAGGSAYFDVFWCLRRLKVRRSFAAFGNLLQPLASGVLPLNRENCSPESWAAGLHEAEGLKGGGLKLLQYISHARRLEGSADICYTCVYIYIYIHIYIYIYIYIYIFLIPIILQGLTPAYPPRHSPNHRPTIGHILHTN